MFNFFKKKPRILNNKKAHTIETDESLAFTDLLRQSVKITREISGNEILIGLKVNDTKLIFDKELCLLLLSVLKEYCLTNDILNSFEMLRDKEEK